MRCSVRTGVKTCIAALLVGLSSSALFADVTITQLANEGVILSDQESARVMIDGMVVEPYSVYGGLSAELSEQFFRAEGPFDDILLALASHQHHDHNQPGPACQFLQVSTGTQFVSSAQVMDLMREKCRQFVTTSPRIRIIDPREGHAAVIDMDAVRVTAFPLSHGVGKYAKLQNFAHLVEIGGLRILHLGDAAMDADNFSKAGVERLNADVVLIPFWFFQPGPGGDIARRFLDVPHQIAVHIPPREMQEVKEFLQLQFPRVLVLENALDQVSFTAAAPPLP
jgi:L-ascorbate metabolism protein UlaG (beta-lactamase superfamily)